MFDILFFLRNDRGYYAYTNGYGTNDRNHTNFKEATLLILPKHLLNNNLALRLCSNIAGCVTLVTISRLGNSNITICKSRLMILTLNRTQRLPVLRITITNMNGTSLNKVNKVCLVIRVITSLAICLTSLIVISNNILQTNRNIEHDRDRRKDNARYERHRRDDRRSKGGLFRFRAPL